jgi:lactate dehydrogenase-like 2-hydroxyacid dehydrogenase
VIVPVTELEYRKGQAVFETVEGIEFVSVPAAEPALAAFVKERACRAVVLGVTPYTGALYRAVPAGGILLRFGVGTDSLDFAQVRERGLLVANTPGALDRSVAEHTLFLVGALLRHIAQGDRALKAGEWTPQAGRELGGLKLAVIGLGRIGYQVARMAHLGFGAQVLVGERDSEQAVAARLGLSLGELRGDTGYALWDSAFEHVLPEADVVSVHLPLNAHTRHIFNRRTFGLCKPGALFVNTARGGLVDEAALAAALREGRLGGAALDVFEHEPYRPVDAESDLRTFPNVIVTPHVASNTAAANRRMAEMVVENLQNWLRADLEAVHLVR